MSEYIKATDALAEHVESTAEWMRSNGYDDTPDRDALTTYWQAREGVDKVKVKPLVWEYPEHHKDAEFASTIVGEYSVWEIDGVGYWRGPEDYSGRRVDGDISFAKAEVFTRYKARIKTALE